MASIISAGTSAGTAIAISGDTTGNLAFQTQAGANTITVPNATGNVMVSGNMPIFRAIANATQTVSINSTTKATCFGTVQWDTASCWSVANNRYTPNVAGYYQITAAMQWGTGWAIGSDIVYIYIVKNGTYSSSSTATMTSDKYVATQYPSSSVGGLMYCNGTTDYIEVYLEAGGASGTRTTYVDNRYDYFSIAMIRTA